VGSFPEVNSTSHSILHSLPKGSFGQISGGLNVAAGTYGRLTARPYTVCLHISKHSFDSARNIQPPATECVVEHTEVYHGHLVAFLRVVGASIDDGMLFLERDEIVSIYPTNYADEILDPNGAVKIRVSLLSDLYLCPTFPVAPKKGWYGTFEIWMRDLADEGHLSGAEYEQVRTWHSRWQERFADLDSAERASLRTKLTELIRLIARERWSELHI
jgi:hypothetical protein